MSDGCTQTQLSEDAPLVFHDSPHDDWLVLPSWNRLHRIFRIAWEGGSPEIECHGQGIAVCGRPAMFLGRVCRFCWKAAKA